MDDMDDSVALRTAGEPWQKCDHGAQATSTFLAPTGHCVSRYTYHRSVAINPLKRTCSRPQVTMCMAGCSRPWGTDITACGRLTVRPNPEMHRDVGSIQYFHVRYDDV
jgi:hypothetical protein